MDEVRKGQDQKEKDAAMMTPETPSAAKEISTSEDVERFVIDHIADVENASDRGIGFGAEQLEDVERQMDADSHEIGQARRQTKVMEKLNAVARSIERLRISTKEKIKEILGKNGTSSEALTVEIAGEETRSPEMLKTEEAQTEKSPLDLKIERAKPCHATLLKTMETLGVLVGKILGEYEKTEEHTGDLVAENASSEKLKKDLDALRTDIGAKLIRATSLVDEIGNSIVPAIREIDMLNTTMDRVQTLQRVVTDSEPTLTELGKLMREIREKRKVAVDVSERYKSALYREYGYVSSEDARVAHEKDFERLNELRQSGNWWKRHFDSKYKEEMRTLGVRIDNFYAFRGKESDADVNNSSSLERYDMNNKLETLMRIAADRVAVFYNTEIAEVPEPTFENAKRTELPRDILTALHREYAERTVTFGVGENTRMNEAHASHQKDDGRPDDPQLIHKAIELLEESFSIQIAPPWNASEDVNEKAREFHRELETLPYDLRQIVDEHAYNDFRISADVLYEDMTRYVDMIDSVVYRQTLLTDRENIFRNTMAALGRDRNSEETTWHSAIDILHHEDFTWDGFATDYKFMKFLEKLNIEHWNIFKNNARVRELLGGKHVDEADRQLQEIILQRVLMAERARSHMKCEGQLQEFQNPDLASVPYVLLDLYRSGSVQEMQGYIGRLTDKDMQTIEQSSIPGLSDLVQLVREHPTSITPTIPNPDLAAFQIEIKQDPEFLDQAFSDIFENARGKNRPVKRFTVVREGAKWPDDIYDAKQQSLYVEEKIFHELESDDSKQLPDIINESDPTFARLRRILAAQRVSDADILRAGGTRTAFYYKDENPIYEIPESAMSTWLAKTNRPSDLFDPRNAQVTNPFYRQLEGDLLRMSSHCLQNGTERERWFVMKILGQLRVDLGEECYAMLGTMLRSADQETKKELIQQMVSRLLHSDERSGEAAKLLIENYQALDRQTRMEIKKKTPSIIMGMYREEHVPPALNDGLAKILEITPEEMDRTFKFLRWLETEQRQHVNLYGDDNQQLVPYIEAANNADIRGCINDLAPYGYQFNPRDLQALREIAGRKDEVLLRLEAIQKDFPQFQYSIRNETEYDKNYGRIDKPITDPYDVVIRHIERGSLLETLGKMQEGPDARIFPKPYADALLRFLKTKNPARQHQKMGAGKTEEISEEETEKFHGALGSFTRQFYPLMRGKSTGNRLRDFLVQNMDTLIAIPDEKRIPYVEVFQRIDNSPAQEIQRLKDSLLKQLLETDDPARSYQEIENVFIKNNLPTVGKIYKVFSILHPAERIRQELRSDSSPVLQHASSRHRQFIIYRDLLNAHIGSGNRSLRTFAEVIATGQTLIDRVETGNGGTLTAKEQKQLSACLGKFETLFQSSRRGKGAELITSANLEKRCAYIREGLEARGNQTITERIVEMFLRPAGLNRLAEIPDRMWQVKMLAHARGLAYAASADGFSLGEGDLLKGVQAQYIKNILQNGSVAKEFLGGGENSDQTPFDTDVSRVQREDAEGGFEEAVKNSLATGYGSLLFVVKDRGQFQETDRGKKARFDQGKLELFRVGEDRHYGIRTGFAATEIDFMVAQENFTGLQELYFEIAQNGWYIPIVDAKGRVIFTPEMYQQYRNVFDGIEMFDGAPIEYIPPDPRGTYTAQIHKIARELDRDQERVENLSTKIRMAVERVLEKQGIALRPEFDTGIVGAELLDIGSTGRHTNTPGSYDFDLTLKLDAKDFPRASDIARTIKAALTIAQDASHSEPNGYYQLRALGVSKIEEEALAEPVDIDIGFAKKSDMSVYGTHDALRDKLGWIQDHIGGKAYKEVLATIILTKKLLKEGHAYKRVEDGGFGGVGVENWILANGGNLQRACETFLEAAYDAERPVPFGEFKERYKILNAGMNVKHLYHDNYTANLTADGYERMRNVIKSVLSATQDRGTNARLSRQNRRKSVSPKT